jgi:hypothetical protein
MLNSNILKVKGESGKILKIGLYRKLFSSILIIIVLYYGIKPFLYAMIIQQLLAFVAISWYGKALINYSIIDQIKDFYLYLILGIVTNLIIVLLIDIISIENIYLVFSFKVILSITFILFILYLFKEKTFYFLINTFKSLRNVQR